MKKIAFSIFLFLVIMPHHALAASIIPSSLVPCGTTATGPCTPCHLWRLADNVTNFTLFGLAGPILTVVLLMGGLIWMTSGGAQKQIEKGKGLLTAGIVGIFIAFGGWLIIDTLIKTLATGDFRTAWNTIEDCPPPIVPKDFILIPPQGIPADGTFKTQAEAEAFLRREGIEIRSTGNCSDPTDKTCTSLVGMPAEAINLLVTLKRNGYDFAVTGGTETGHKEHAINNPVVDIKPLQTSSGDYRALRDQVKTLGGNAYCEDNNGARYLGCDSLTTHVHIRL